MVTSVKKFMTISMFGMLFFTFVLPIAWAVDSDATGSALSDRVQDLERTVDADNCTQ